MRPAALLFATLAASLLPAAAQDDAVPAPGPAPVPAAPVAPAAPAAPRVIRDLEVNGIAAKVNGSVVTKNELYSMLAPTLAELMVRYPRRGAEFEKQALEARDKVLDELIDSKLILHEAKDKGANLRPQMIDEEIERQIKELHDGSEERFRAYLKFRHLTMDGYRKLTRDQLIVQIMRMQHSSTAAPPLPSEVQAEYEAEKMKLRDLNQDKISFRRIFLPKGDRTNVAVTAETQLALAESLVKELEAGADFAELAKKHSADHRAAEGGEWPDTPRSDLEPEFAAVLFDAPEGKVVGPLDDRTGYSIVIIKDKQLGPPPPFAKVRDRMEQQVRIKKSAERYERWIKSLRKRAVIERTL